MNQEKIMNSTLAGWFVAGTLLGLLAAPSASARKEDPAEVLIVQFHRLPVDRGYSSDELRLVRFDRPAPPAPDRGDVRFLTPTDWSAEGTSALAVLTRKDGTNRFAPVAVAGGSVRAWKTLPATSPRNVSRPTVLAGMPDWLWCRFFCKRGM